MSTGHTSSSFAFRPPALWVSAVLEKIIHNCEYLYFLKNELDTAITTICRYIDGDIEERQNILKENS